MTISQRVQQQFFSATSADADTLIRLPPTVVVQYAKCTSEGTRVNRTRGRAKRRTNLWTVEEHERFLRGLELFPVGPRKEVAAIVGTKTTRQTMTHAQKYRQKIERHMRNSTSKHSKSDGKASPALDTSTLYADGAIDDEAALVACSPALDFSVSSPLDVTMDVFDHSLFDEDLTALLNSIDPIWSLSAPAFDEPEVEFSFGASK